MLNRNETSGNSIHHTPMAVRSPQARSIALALLLGLTHAASPAGAASGPQPTQASVEEAKRRVQRGRELYEENDFQAALVEFRRAYELAPTYRLLFDIGQIQYQLQDYPGAMKSLSRFLQEGQGNVSAQQREDVQKEIERLKTRVATLRITASVPGAEISIDDVSVGTAPLAEPVMVSAGRRKVTASAPGHATTTRTLEVAGLDGLDVQLDLTKLAAGETEDGDEGSAAPDRPGEPRASQGKSSAPVVLWVMTGGLAIGAAITGGLAMSASSDLSDKLESFGTSRGEVDDARSTTKTLALTTDILLAATAVAAGAAIYFTVAGGDPDEKSASARTIRVGVGPGRVGVAGTF